MFICRGPFKGRIGCYDDDDDRKAIVYFGSLFCNRGYYLIPTSYLRPANTRDFVNRREEIRREVYLAKDEELSPEEQCSLLLELNYIDGELYGNYFRLRYGESKVLTGKKVFISHSSKDKHFVNTLATDLHNCGIEPWVDEWKIRVGESIPTKIGNGIKESDFVILVLSKSSTRSKWVEAEWQAKYWHEIQKGRVALLPILLEDCEVPELLKTKKYADFTEGYYEGLTRVLDAIAA